MQLELCKEFTFEASHILPKHPGKCSRLHGHSWKLRVYVKGEINGDTGFVMDYAELKKVVQPLIDDLDHRHLGSWWDAGLSDDPNNYSTWRVPGMPSDFYPSSENLIVWIASELDRLGGRFVNEQAYLNSVIWNRLELDETCTSKCILTREEFERANFARNG